MLRKPVSFFSHWIIIRASSRFLGSLRSLFRGHLSDRRKYGNVSGTLAHTAMDALQLVSSATQLVSSTVGAVAALEQASRDLEEAPKKIKRLEELVYNLENLSHRIKQKHVSKLQNPRLNNQI